MSDISALTLDELVNALTTGEWSPVWLRPEIERRFAVLERERDEARELADINNLTAAHALDRADAAERDLAVAREALQEIARYFAAEFREGEKAYQAVIIARAALAGVNGAVVCSRGDVDESGGLRDE